MITSKPRHQRPKRYCRKKAEYPLEGNCQVNNVVYKCDVTRPLPKKCILDLQRENGRAVSITIIYHLNTRDIPIRQRFQVTQTPNLKWSVLRCVPPYSNISKKSLLH